MLVVDIDVWPGGWADNKRAVQRLAIWNVSDLAAVSDYEYALSRPYGRDLIGEPPSARWLASNRNDPQVEHTGRIEGHERARQPWELVKAVLDAIAS